MSLKVIGGGLALWRGREMRCAIGHGGIVSDKREGDGGTPVGVFPLRSVLYRADRLGGPPHTMLDHQPIAPEDGWCDAPGDPQYNRPVRHPYPASAERLWREDGCYDLLAIMGHNDAPVRDGLGSGIFLHVARPDFSPTEGCVALTLEDLTRVLGEWTPSDRVEVPAR